MQDSYLRELNFDMMPIRNRQCDGKGTVFGFFTFMFVTQGTSLQFCCLSEESTRGSLLCIWGLQLRIMFPTGMGCHQACWKVQVGDEWMISRPSPILGITRLLKWAEWSWDRVFCVLGLELSLFCFVSPDPHFNLWICVPSDIVATGHMGLLSTWNVAGPNWDALQL